MCAILLSINPQYVEKILNGTKRYEGRKHAVAYKLTNVIEYSEPKKLKDYGISAAPQSFRYIDEM